MRTLTYGGLTVTQTLGYLDGANSQSSVNATGRVGSLTSKVGSTTTNYSYSYDARGNITHIYIGGVLKYSYTYDNLNQLTRENNAVANKTYTYTYDDAGNILYKRTYAYTTGSLGTATSTNTYTYGNTAWGDRLTAFNGTTMGYDKLGNPTSYYNGTPYNFSWTKGRQLSAVLYGSVTTTYTYNADGIRTKKVGSSTVEYVLDGTKILAEKNGSHIIRYLYDAQDMPVGMILDGTTYLYEKNLQGDIVGIYTTSGTKVVTYNYDAWGKMVSYSVASGYTSVYTYNPFRYRGYYYDNETGFYYLQSRYYDPTTGRFLNADGELSGANGTLHGYNLFIYCFNNPINMNDSMGQWPKWLMGALNTVSGVAQMATGATLGAFASWTGVGAVAAGFLIINGAATTAQGIGQIVNDVTQSNVLREDNIIRTGVESVGQTIGGEIGATIAGGVYDAAVIAANLYSGTAVKTPSACFVAGTAILTSFGSKAIEEIKKGDMVWSQNTVTGEISLKAVVQVFVRESKELVYLYVNGEKIITTPEHPFYVPTRGWTTAIQLQTGDVLVTQNERYVIVEKIKHVILESSVKVYNFEVDEFHTYYVGNNSVLVHNTCQKFTPDQQAVIELARESKKGLSKSQANILVEWADEYGISAHGPMIHPNRSGIWSLIEHIKIFNEHIPVE